MSWQLGAAAELSRTFTAEDLADYAELSGDHNPIYVTLEQVPGPLLGGMISTLLGTELPGRGTNWMKQRFSFVTAAPLGTRITARVEIVRLRPEKDLVNLRTTCVDEEGRLLAEGEALVMARDMLRPGAYSRRTAGRPRSDDRGRGSPS